MKNCLVFCAERHEFFPNVDLYQKINNLYCRFNSQSLSKELMLIIYLESLSNENGLTSNQQVCNGNHYRHLGFTIIIKLPLKNSKFMVAKMT